MRMFFCLLLCGMVFPAFTQVKKDTVFHKANTNNFGIFRLDNGAVRLYHVNYDTREIKIHKTDYSLETTITFPAQTSTRYIILGLSDKTFDTDKGYEYIILSDNNRDAYFYLVDDDGGILLNERNCWIPNDDDDGYGYRRIKSMYEEGGDVKMLVYYYDNTVKVFSFPGRITF